MSGPRDPLSPRGEALVGNLWQPEHFDPSVIAIMRAGADELDAIEALMLTVREQAWPHKANDLYGLLGLHERMLELPIQPAGVPLATRQNATRAAIQSRRVGSAKRWEQRMNSLLHGAPWRYERNHPGPGQLTITIPFDPNSYSAAQIQAIAERITPAHIEIILRYEQGWLAGISRAGTDAV